MLVGEQLPFRYRPVVILRPRYERDLYSETSGCTPPQHATGGLDETISRIGHQLATPVNWTTNDGASPARRPAISRRTQLSPQLHGLLRARTANQGRSPRIRSAGARRPRRGTRRRPQRPDARRGFLVHAPLA